MHAWSLPWCYHTYSLVQYISSLTVNFPELQPMSRVTARQSSLWMLSPWRNSRPVPWPKYLNIRFLILRIMYENNIIMHHCSAPNQTAWSKNKPKQIKAFQPVSRSEITSKWFKMSVCAHGHWLQINQK